MLLDYEVAGLGLELRAFKSKLVQSSLHDTVGDYFTEDGSVFLELKKLRPRESPTS